ncbi:apolipoprotein M isoform X2 [Bombina bombina]|uniref:apolipoprotein M isoform X2 n=1 Tax=Bombina bombina TaxID=8345 RepID=UPI00235A6CDA|nr:apolipoprotein M isoform X2 [Bombina bombina]
MIINAWHYLVYLYGMVIDSLSVCDTSERLSAYGINRTQYMGRWYFLAAASSPGTDALKIFTLMDNAEFAVHGSDNQDSLIFRAAIRAKDGSCIPRKWIYLLTENSTDLRTEGHPDRLTELFASRCPHCAILKETENSTSRLLLYSRFPQLEEEFMDEFRDKSSCEGFKDVLKIPQKKEYCHLVDAGS